MTPEGLKKDLLALPESERAELAHLLIESLGDGEDPDSQDAWDAELRRRASEITEGTAQGRPATEVIDEMRRKYS